LDDHRLVVIFAYRCHFGAQVIDIVLNCIVLLCIFIGKQGRIFK